MSPRAWQAVIAAALVMVLGLAVCGTAPSPSPPPALVGTELPTKPEDTMPEPGEVSPRRTH